MKRGQIHYLSKRKRNGSFGGHDVVILKTYPSGYSKVSTFSSLEKEEVNPVAKKKFYHVTQRKAERAKQGIVKLLPIKASGSQRWDGIYQSSKYVNNSDLERRRFHSKTFLSEKYLK